MGIPSFPAAVKEYSFTPMDRGPVALFEDTKNVNGTGLDEEFFIFAS
jgi:hypothetical protein